MEKRSKAEMTACPTGPSSATSGSEASSTASPAARPSSSSGTSRTAAAATLSERRKVLVESARTPDGAAGKLPLAAVRMRGTRVAKRDSGVAWAGCSESARRRRAEGRTLFMARRAKWVERGLEGSGRPASTGKTTRLLAKKPGDLISGPTRGGQGQAGRRQLASAARRSAGGEDRGRG